MALDLLTHTGFLAVLGGAFSSARNAFKDKDKTPRERVLDIAVGVLMAYAVSDFFIAENGEKIAILNGLIAGVVGTPLLDQITQKGEDFAHIIINLFSKGKE